MSDAPESAKGMTVLLTKIVADINTKDPNVVDKVTFETDKGNITYKIYKQQVVIVSGIETRKTVFINLGDMPEKVKKLAKIIQEKGKVELIVDYHIFNKEVDGEIKNYKYLNDADFKEWAIKE